MESFSLYQEILSCTSVSACVSGRFNGGNEMVLARHNSIEMYTFTAPLQLVCRSVLQGVVLGLGKFKSTLIEKELVVVVTKEAKLSVLLFNAPTRSFEVVALISFENEKPEQPVKLLSDPESRCLVMKVNSWRAFIIPAKSPGRPAKEDGFTHSYLKQEIFSPVFAVELPFLAYDLALLKGYSEPLLTVLFCPSPLGIHNTVTFFSVQLKKKELRVLREQPAMPSDCTKLIPLEPPLSGVFVLRASGVIYMSLEGGEVFGLDWNLSFASWVFIDSFRVLFSTHMGELVLLGINYSENSAEMMQAVFSVTLFAVESDRALYSPQLIYSSPLLFTGSCLHDSFLFAVDLQDPQGKYIKLQLLESVVGLSGAISSSFLNWTRKDEQEVREMLVCNGFGKNSYLSRVTLSVYPLILLAYEEESFPGLSEITDIFTIQGTHSDAYVLITKGDGLNVLKIDESIDDVTGACGFIESDATIGAGRISSQLIYQATSKGLRILNSHTELIKDLELPSICKIVNIDSIFGILYKDGTFECLLVELERQVSLWKTTEIVISINCFVLKGQKTIAIARPEGLITFSNMETGELLAKLQNGHEGSYLLSDEDNSDLSITDPTNRILLQQQPEEVWLVEILAEAYGDFIVLLLRLNTGEVFIYQNFESFRFTRLSSFLYMGPYANPDISRQFYTLSQGLFVTHPSSNFWVIPNVTRRTLHIHPNIDNGEILAISSFNCVDCPRGFIFREGNKLKIGHIEEDIERTLAADILMTRVACDETLRQILVKLPYVIASSFVDNGEVLYSIKIYLFSEDEGLTELSSPIKRFVPNEVVMAMCFVNFDRKLNPPYEYLVIGTGIIGTEDTAPQGRVLLYAIHEDKLESQQLHRTPGLKGAISALASIHGYLLVGAGSEVKIFTFVDKEGEEWLEPIALHYGYTMACSLDVQGTKILCTETRNQMYVFDYEEESNKKNLVLVGQYFRELTPIVACFHFNRQVVSDEYQNILVFSCDPNSEKLEKIGDIHTGMTIYTISRSQENALIMPSQEGGVGMLYATSEVVYKKMHTLITALVETLPFTAGLNSRNYRLCYSKERERQRKGILDLGLIMTYCYLSGPLQRLIARNIGTTRQNILEEISGMPYAHHYL